MVLWENASTLWYEMHDDHFWFITWDRRQQKASRKRLRAPRCTNTEKARSVSQNWKNLNRKYMYLLEVYLPPASGVSHHSVQLMFGTKSCSHLPLHSSDKLTQALSKNDIRLACAPSPHMEALEVYRGRKRHKKQNALQHWIGYSTLKLRPFSNVFSFA